MCLCNVIIMRQQRNTGVKQMERRNYTEVDCLNPPVIDRFRVVIGPALL